MSEVGQFRRANSDDSFLFQTQVMLLNPEEMGQIGSTLCLGIHTSKGRVLPRMHTPQNGLTVRSLSHHLAYCPASDIKPSWFPNPKPNVSEHSFNLLVIPWPKAVDSAQFKASKQVNLTDEVGPGGYGLFTYRLKKGPRPTDVQRLVEIAEDKVGAVHGIVFPELSMSESEFRAISRRVIEPERLLVAGIGEEARSSKKCGKNQALIQVAAQFTPKYKVKTEFRQKKHHRWKLTRSQIVQYGIGTNLHPEADWWEHISLEERSLAFINFRPWLTCTVLICEDLARPDPVGDLLRAVGPNLVIALLSDGPQLRSRWPGRYAGALADDPGCSVLTVTSGGMSRLSRAADGTKDRSGVVALWRDPKNGERELELPDSKDALLLNLTVQYDEERTADGRSDHGASGYPILSGYHPISL